MKTGHGTGLAELWGHCFPQPGLSFHRGESLDGGGGTSRWVSLCYKGITLLG